MAKDPEELRKLEADWDSYGAKTITEEAIATAKAIEYTPSSDGGLDIILAAGGVDLEIEINPDGSVTSIYWELPKPMSERTST